MTLKTITVVLVLTVFLGLSLSSTAEGDDMIKDDQARQVIETYVDRYKAMDLNLFMELYSRKAVENQVLPYADIRATYKRMFAETNQFLYYPTIYSIQTYPHHAFVTGGYTVIQTLKKGNRLRQFHGKIQWTLVPEGESLKIREINYGRSGGD